MKKMFISVKSALPYLYTYVHVRIIYCVFDTFGTSIYIENYCNILVIIVKLRNYGFNLAPNMADDLYMQKDYFA